MTELSGFLALPCFFAVVTAPPAKWLADGCAHAQAVHHTDAAGATGLHMPFRREERPAVEAPG